MVNAYANALAPSFWYLVPLGVVGVVAALFLKEIKLSDKAGLTEEADETATEHSATT